MLAPPRQLEILPLQIRNKVWACLATRFNVQLNVVKSVIKLDRPITQYSRVSRLEGGDLIIGRHFVKAAGDSQDASFVSSGSCLSFHICNFSPSAVYTTCRS